MNRSLELPPVGLNTWPLGVFADHPGTRPRETLETARAEGVRLIDTAPYYGAGRANRLLREVRNRTENGDEGFLILKGGLVRTRAGGWAQRESVAELREELETSLRQLGVDRIDCYQLIVVEPSRVGRSAGRFLDRIRAEELTRFTGLVHPPLSLLRRFRGEAPVDVVQTPYNLFDRTAEGTVLPYCATRDIRVVVDDPLSGGLLTQQYIGRSPRVDDEALRRYHPGFTDERRTFLRAVRAIHRLFDRSVSSRHGERSLPPFETLMLGWTLSHPDVSSVLVGARTADDVSSAARTCDWVCSREQRRRVLDCASQFVDGNRRPEFVAPPPLCPRHTFERHVVVRGTSDRGTL